MRCALQEAGSALGIGHLGLGTACKAITECCGRSLLPGEATAISFIRVPIGLKVGPESCANCRAGVWAKGGVRVCENELVAM
jgi:hypothetical protein